MALTLEITSFQSQVLGSDGCKVFDKTGGSIGRAQGNDWVLPDPERYISGRHFAVSYEGDSYYLTDTSTNGVYINHSASPVGKGNAVPLNNGDQLKFGDYEIAVSIDNTSNDAEPFGGWQAPDNTGGNDPFSSSNDPFSGGNDPFSGGNSDTGGFADTAGFMEQESPTDGDFDIFSDARNTAPHAFDIPATEPDHVSSLEQAFQPPGTQAEQLPDDWDLTDYSSESEPEQKPASWPAGPREIPRPANQPASTGHGATQTQAPPASAQQNFVQPPPQPVQPSPAAAVQASGDALELFAAFMEGAGLDPQSVNELDAKEAMRNYGMLFRTVVQGMMEVLMARASLKSEFRMPLTTIRPVENNPLKFSPTVDDALRNLFIVQGRGYLDPVDAIQEGFSDIKNHQVAMMAGMQAAFRELMELFHPDKYDTTDRGARRVSLMSAGRKSKAWDAYCEFYTNTTRDAGSSFQNLFGENFATAYEEQIRRLTTLK